MQIYLGSLYVNDFNRFGRTYQVNAQADLPFRLEPNDILKLKVRNDAGDMVPLGSFVTLEQSSGPTIVQRYNGYVSAEITGGPAPGYSSGQAQAAITDLANASLPNGLAYDWTELAYQQEIAGNTAVWIFPLCVLLAFLVLAAQYESWGLPFSVLLGTPFAAFGAYFGLYVARQYSESYVNNIFAQIGLIMLIGLAAKNAILIVEFAKLKRDEGEPIVQAALDGAKLRLRPILMTSFAFILGSVPLAIALGAGAGARQALGTAVVFGMLMATLVGVFFIPMFYVLLQRVSEGQWPFRRADPGVPIAGGGAPTSAPAAPER
jgi:multidrug efflux pump subunit AcrB